jgi:hypothetical protein
MIWLGHCVVNIRTVLRSLPSAGQLMLISDLREFLDREERETSAAEVIPTRLARRTAIRKR